MSNINSVTLTGNLTADPESRNFDNGGSITSLRLAVNGGYTNRQTSQFVEQVSYFDVEVKNNQAPACAQILRKGMRVAILGRLEQQRWETPDGNRSKVVVVAQRVEFPQKSAQADQGNHAPEEKAVEPELPVESPTLPAAADGVKDDDIPF